MTDTNEGAAGAPADQQVGPNPEEEDLINKQPMYPSGDGVGSTGDLTGPGEIDTLKQMDGDVPLPAGLDHHAPIPERRT
jgi:hypothetical protein